MALSGAAEMMALALRQRNMEAAEEVRRWDATVTAAQQMSLAAGAMLSAMHPRCSAVVVFVPL
jgi:hypothetical protein